ncbi:MAG: hypothetical protein Q7I99_04110 [Acholeplasmataceae bacterium]|nr:hypothetical protein [Acholeplasmataceae bacterium]
MRLIISKKRKEVERKMTDFIQGEIAFDDFLSEYKNDTNMVRFISESSAKTNSWFYNIDDLESLDFSKLSVRAGFISTIINYLNKRKVTFNSLNRDLIKYNEYSAFIPNWLDFDDENIVVNVIDSVSSDIPKEDRKRIIKKKLHSIFKYEKRPPKWLQNPEWPIINGNPSIFLRQDGDPNDLTKDVVNYYFFDVASKKEITVTQFI